MSEQNKAMVHNLFDEVWNQGNLVIIDERLSSLVLSPRPSRADIDPDQEIWKVDGKYE